MKIRALRNNELNRCITLGKERKKMKEGRRKKKKKILKSKISLKMTQRDTCFSRDTAHQTCRSQIPKCDINPIQVEIFLLLFVILTKSIRHEFVQIDRRNLCKVSWHISFPWIKFPFSGFFVNVCTLVSLVLFYRNFKLLRFAVCFKRKSSDKASKSHFNVSGIE